MSGLLYMGCCSSSTTYDNIKCSTNMSKNIFHVFFCFSVSLSSWHISITVFGVVNSVIVFTSASTTFNSYKVIIKFSNNVTKLVKISIILQDNKYNQPLLKSQMVQTQMEYPILMQQLLQNLLYKVCFHQHFVLVVVHFLVNLLV